MRGAGPLLWRRDGWDVCVLLSSSGSVAELGFECRPAGSMVHALPLSEDTVYIKARKEPCPPLS